MWKKSQKKFEIKENTWEYLRKNGEKYHHQRSSLKEHICLDICKNRHVQDQWNSRKKNARGTKMEWRARPKKRNHGKAKIMDLINI